MKKVILSAILVLCASFSRADTNTNRFGLVQISTSPGDIWGTKTNANWATVDAGAAGLSLYNLFATTNTFFGAVYFSTNTITPGGYMTVDGTGLLTTQAGGGAGGASSLAVGLGTSAGFTVRTSSPTGAMTFNPNQFNQSLAGGATAYTDLNPSTTYYIHNSASAQTAAINISTATIGIITSNSLKVSTLTVTSSTTLTQVTVGTMTILSSSSVNGIMQVNGYAGGSIYLPDSAIMHGTLSPTSYVDMECGNSDASPCGYFKHTTESAIGATSSGNNQTIGVTNTFSGTPTSGGQWASAIYASNSAEGTNQSVAGYFQSNGSTGVYITNTGAGTGLRINISGASGNAIQIDSGKLQFPDGTQQTTAGGSNILPSTNTWTGQQTWTSASPSTFTYVNASTFTLTGFTNATLGNSPNGTLHYCSDCTVTTPATCLGVISAACVCAGSGNGAFAKRLNGSWYCN